MKCPECNHEQSCPCPSCQSLKPTENPWVWIDGEAIKCGNCDFKKSADWWLHYEMELYKTAKKLKEVRNNEN